MGILITHGPGYQHCRALFLVFSVACLSLVHSPPANAISGNETDRLTLLEFKAKITSDPYGIMSSWNDSSHFCNWFGVTCGRRHARVTELNLTSCHLGGSISPHIGNLSFLRVVDLSHNRLLNQIPSELGYLWRMQMLYLLNNSLSGEIPFNLSKCTQLLHLELAYNKLVGEIPKDLASLSKLQRLLVHSNALTGEVPPSLGNLSSLEILSTSINNLVGNIPHTLGRLKQLTLLRIGINQLSSTVPHSIFNLSSLTSLDMCYNHLKGYLPSDLFITLPNLQVLSVDMNQFTGSIPTSLSNASNLQSLYLDGNSLTGKVPGLWKLKAINEFHIYNNSLGTRARGDLNFLCSLTNASYLQTLVISSNEFGGSLPDCISNLSSELTGFWLNENYISGSIPPAIDDLVNLKLLSASDNKLSGKVPSFQKLNALIEFSIANNSLGMSGPGDLDFLCSLTNATDLEVIDIGSNNLGGSLPECSNNLTSKLLIIWMADNHISGSIPDGIPNFVAYLSMAKNNIDGRIPQSLCNATQLDTLDLGDNHLEGTIPDCLIELSQTVGVFNLRGNNLVGTIPNKFRKGCRLHTLNLNRNFLQGQIPTSLANCKNLTVLDLGNNQLNGIFPCELKTLSHLQVLILKSNKFSGHMECPGIDSIWPLLQILDLASNQFTGEIIARFILKWRLMMTGTKELQRAPNLLEYSSHVRNVSMSYDDAVILTFKNNDFEVQKVLKIFTTIDLSNNAFHGEIPRGLGNLNALIFLNLSHNSLSGNIPSSFGNLSQLESLDLSSNALSGHIPPELANLNFLEWLNLSFNRLVGPIPTSTQLQSFDPSSYKGNAGLYGPPLTGVHANVPASKPSTSADGSQWSSESKVEWMLQGAEVGFPVGLTIFVGPLLYIKRWRRWYCRHLGRLVMKAMGREDQTMGRRRGRRQVQQQRHRA